MGFLTSAYQKDAARSNIGFGAADTNLTAVLAGASHSKGSWVEISSSTPHDAHGFLLREMTEVDGPYLLDIGIGGAGSEVAIVENFLNDTRSDMAKAVYIPLFIPVGTRITGRAQSSAAQNDKLGLALIRKNVAGLPLYAKATTYGAVTADSGGTSVDPGGSANTKGAWTEITSSTSREHHAWLFQIGMQTNLARTDCQWLVDVAVGAASSEYIILGDYPMALESNYDNNSCVPPILFYQTIPSASRLSVRMQCSITDAADRTLDFIVMGFS